MNWFAAKPQATVLERTWLTGSAKLAGVIVQVREICAASRALPILAHFDDAREDVKAVLNQAGIPHVELDRLITPTQLPSLLGSSVRVVVGSTKFLNVETVGAKNEALSDTNFPAKCTQIIVNNRKFLSPGTLGILGIIPRNCFTRTWVPHAPGARMT